MLQLLDRCCRRDEMLGQRKRRSRDRAWQMTGARRGWRRNGGWGAARMGSSRGWPDAIASARCVADGRTRFVGARSDVTAGASNVTRVQASEISVRMSES
jgi:hypothetical protein